MLTFTRNEKRDLIIAFVVLSISFAISNAQLNLHTFISVLPIVMVGVAIGSLVRELGAKFVAVKYGYQAEFKAWPLGLLITFASAFIGIVFAFPGFVQTYADNISDEINGKIAIAGPMANMVLALISIAIAALIFPLKPISDIFTLIYLICTIGFSVNSFLATFNLLPFYTLDGIKVLKWNAKIWIVIFAIAVIMLLMSIGIGAENMVKLIIDAVAI
ncbi:site-2 protease family protein [uncultured Methanobrevibacter sp.]|uniref:site-2 protease family protein n=1 Tax=uncultured Methanobrevibacter sp. TaxID=253161 RepID=UPI00261074BA|nr:site-2 protease family protein [uncultured Methanobrevibacter sp.]